MAATLAFWALLSWAVAALIACQRGSRQHDPTLLAVGVALWLQATRKILDASAYLSGPTVPNLGREAADWAAACIVLGGLLYSRRRAESFAGAPSPPRRRGVAGSAPRGRLLRLMQVKQYVPGLLGRATLGLLVVLAAVHVYSLARRAVADRVLAGNLQLAHTLSTSSLRGEQDLDQFNDRLIRLWRRIERPGARARLRLVSSDNQQWLSTDSGDIVRSARARRPEFRLVAHGPQAAALFPFAREDLVLHDWVDEGEHWTVAAAYVQRRDALVSIEVPRSNIDLPLRDDLLPWMITGLAFVCVAVRAPLVQRPVGDRGGPDYGSSNSLSVEPPAAANLRSLTLPLWGADVPLPADVPSPSPSPLADPTCQVQPPARDEGRPCPHGATELVADLISEHDRHGTILYVSPTCEHLLGYRPEDLIGRRSEEFIHPDDHAAAMRGREQLIAGASLERLRYRARCSDGRYVWLETIRQRRSDPVSGAFSHVFAVSRDVTAQVEGEQQVRDHQAQLAHADRLSTLGRMLTEIVHEVHQPLCTIATYAEASQELLRDIDHPRAAPLRECSALIRSQAARTTEILSRLREFARRQPPAPALCDLAAIVCTAVEFMRVQARRQRIELSVLVTEPAPWVRVDRILIEQVLVNLLQNACEALEQHPAPSRSVRVVVECRDDHARVVVEDNGPGLADAAVDQLFAAFHTTKSDGLGMGLPVCRALVESHGGRIWAEQAVPRGAAFCFTLPLASEARTG